MRRKRFVEQAMVEPVVRAAGDNVICRARVEARVGRQLDAVVELATEEGVVALGRREPERVEIELPQRVAVAHDDGARGHAPHEQGVAGTPELLKANPGKRKPPVHGHDEPE
jgi:hypothetical protein